MQTEESTPCVKPRAVLSKDQVVNIFRLSVNSPDKVRPSATSVAKQYNVSEKTIRDIWRGRTWHEETLPFDCCRRPRKAVKTGRPLGRKDSAPRKRRSSTKHDAELPSHSDERPSDYSDISSEVDNARPCESEYNAASNPIEVQERRTLHQRNGPLRKRPKRDSISSETSCYAIDPGSDWIKRECPPASPQFQERDQSSQTMPPTTSWPQSGTVVHPQLQLPSLMSTRPMYPRVDAQRGGLARTSFFPNSFAPATTAAAAAALLTQQQNLSSLIQVGAHFPAWHSSSSSSSAAAAVMAPILPNHDQIGQLLPRQQYGTYPPPPLAAADLLRSLICLQQPLQPWLWR
jgi:hypothetical protein